MMTIFKYVDTVHAYTHILVPNPCRCESFNSLLRAYNIYANRGAPSRDIANSFAVMDHLRFICSGGIVDGSHRLVTTLCVKICHVLMYDLSDVN